MWASFTRAARAASLGSACLFVVGGCGGQFEKLSESSVDASQKATADAFATRFYTGCRDGRVEELGAEATPEMRAGLSVATQKSACASSQSMFGDFQSLDYVEAWKVKGGLFLYRFKGHFSKSDATPEIRVVLDGDAKVSGFWLKPWSDELR